MQVISGSLLCQFILLLWRKASSFCSHSVLVRLLRSLSELWTRWWHGSVLVRFFFGREGLFPRVWAQSRTARLLDLLLNLPAALLHRLYRALKPAFDGSFFANLAFSMGDHAPVAIGWLMLLIMNIPYERWSNGYSFAGYLLIFVLTVAGGMRRRTLRLDTAAVGPYVTLFLLAVALSWPLSMYPALSYRFLTYHITCALCIFLVVSTVERAEQLERLAGFACLGMAGASVSGILQRIEGVAVNASFVDVALNAGMPGRVYSHYENPNSFAQMLVLMIPIAVGLLFGAKKAHWRIVGLGSALLGALALVMTYSRACWVGLVVAALVFLFFWNRKLIPVCIVAALACLPILPDSIFNRILTIFNPNDSSTSSRFPLYQAALRMIGASPVTGVGLGTHAVKAAIIERNFYESFSSYAHSHNLFLQVWLETGLLGIFAFVAAMFSGLKQGAKVFLARTGPRSVRLLVLGALSGLTGALVCGLADYLWTYPRVMLIFWFTAALLLAGIKLAKQEAQR